MQGSWEVREVVLVVLPFLQPIMQVDNDLLNIYFPLPTGGFQA